MITKLVTFKDFNRNSPYQTTSTATEHTDLIHKYGSVLWGQFSARGENDDFSPRAYQEMNNNGNGCIVYALDRNSMLLKMKVDRVLKKTEVLDEHLEHLIPSYYGIDMPVHCYFQISEILAVDPSHTHNLIHANSLRLLDSYTVMRINGTAPWNINEVEIDGNQLITPVNIFEVSPKLKALPDKLYLPSTASDKTWTIYRVYHKDVKLFPHLQYVGETCDLDTRIRDHFSPTNYLRERKKYLYTIMHAFGNENFTWQILEDNIPTELDARKREAYWIEVYHSYYGDQGLNERNERRFLR